MELKQLRRRRFKNNWTLLIVPYGIETPQMALPYESASLLLIVPYGIETVFLN